MAKKLGKVLVDVVALRSSMIATLTDSGLDGGVAFTVVSHLVRSEIVGRATHGLVRFRSVLDSITPDAGVCEIEHSVSVVRVDANQLPGIFALERGISVALDRLEKERVILVGVRNFRGTTGNLGLHVWEVARRGYAAIATCNSRALMAAPDGSRPVVGTNPIAYAFPASCGDPVVGDFASSMGTYGELMLASIHGTELREEYILNDRGQHSQSPGDIENGSILPSGGPRGYSQAVMIELICGALVGGKIGPGGGGDSAFVIAFNSDVFLESNDWSKVDEFRQAVEVAGNSIQEGAGLPRLPGGRYSALYPVTPDSWEFDPVIIGELRDCGVNC